MPCAIFAAMHAIRTALLLAACAALAAIGCTEDRPPPAESGGAGGIAGTGGAGGGGPTEEEKIRALCERACAHFAACGEDDAACLDDCLGAPAPSEHFAPCVECLESTSCTGGPLACRRGVACDMAWDLRVSAEGLSAHEGRIARVLVVESVPDERWVDHARDVRIAGGGLDVRFVGALPQWEMPFAVVVLVDADGDEACDPASGDRAFRREIGIPDGDAHVHFVGDEPGDADACAYWTAIEPRIVLEGSGFAADEGLWAIAAPVWYADDFLTIGAFAVAPVEDGAFRFELGDFGDYVDELAEGSELVAAWMIDRDGDWVCSDADAGGTGPIPLSARGFERRVEATPTPAGTAPCRLLRGLGHDVRLEGGGYDAFEGNAFQAAILDGARVQARATGTVQGGRVEASFARAGVPGVSYVAVLWIDADGDGRCALPADGLFAWDVVVGDGALLVEAPLPGAAADPARCAPFDLRPKGSGE